MMSSRSDVSQHAHAFPFARSLAALLLVVAAMAGLGTGVAHAEGSKIGFVSLERILRDSAAAKAALQKLDQEFSKRRQGLEESSKQLQSMAAKLERDAAVMSEADRRKLQKETADFERDLQRRQREFREDANRRQNEETALILERATRAIRQVAEAEKVDIVFQDAVYASPRIDITDKVLRALNASGSR
ncbi:MAG: hypothetical protein RJA58_1523 [Pseudomonadota bacterium]